MSEERTIIEIGGVKLEVDLRQAKRIEHIRIGDKVKILKKNDYGDPAVYAGVVVGFEPFASLPTICVAYVDREYNKASIKVVHINAKAKNYELIVAGDDDLGAERDSIAALFNRQIAEKQREIEVLEEQRTYFETNFRQYWERVVQFGATESTLATEPS